MIFCVSHVSFLGKLEILEIVVSVELGILGRYEYLRPSSWLLVEFLEFMQHLTFSGSSRGQMLPTSHIATAMPLKTVAKRHRHFNEHSCSAVRFK